MAPLPRLWKRCELSGFPRPGQSTRDHVHPDGGPGRRSGGPAPLPGPLHRLLVTHAGAPADVPSGVVAEMVVAPDADAVSGLPVQVFVAGPILVRVLLGVAVWGAVPRWAALALIVS